MHSFRSDTDTEVLLHGYEEWGIEKLLDKMAGMWAFFIIDMQKKQAYLVRDRFGIKPLYHDNDGKALVFEIFRKLQPNAVIHAAAETNVDKCETQKEHAWNVNVEGTRNVAEACAEVSAKLIHISTDYVFDGEKGYYKEEDKLNPRNPYSASKAGAELLCQDYSETYDLPVIITRSSNNYGPYQHPEKLIPKTIIYALLNKSIPVYGTGENVRDWIYVEDNCEAIDLVLQKSEAGEIYNIAANQELKNLQVVKTVLKLAKKPESLIEFVKDRIGHDLRYSLNTERIRELGWRPRTTFEVGIKKTVEWYKTHTEWWKPILEKEQTDFHRKSR